MTDVAQIPEALIAQSWTEVGGMSPTRGTREVERLMGAQTELFTFVLEATADLAPEAHELALYMAVVIYRAYEKAFPPSPPAATAEEIVEIFEKNHSWLEETAGAHERIVDERILPNMVIPQPAAMAYVGESLFEPEDEEAELEEEDQGLVFLTMKTFVEILDRCAARRDQDPPAWHPKGKGGRRPRAEAVPVYQLKITLKGIRPPIWRRLRVPADVSLPVLHRILQAAMGWTDSHLHQFRSGPKVYGVPDPEGFALAPPVLDERRARLSTLAPGEKARFTYEYDLGDGWEHAVVVEKVLTPEPGEQAPLCLAGRRACPPEDCGGPWGYEEMLETLGDREDPHRQEVLEWLGGEWDPEAFDQEQVNALLSDL